MEAGLVKGRSGYDAAAIAAREAEITGRPQRIAPLAAEELTPEVLDLVTRIRATIGLGPSSDIAEYARTVLKHPEIFRRQMEMGAVIFSGALPPRERELAVLRVGWLMRAPFEWGEHVDIAKRYGVTPQEIERVIEGAGAPGWSEHDAAILRAVEELLSEQAISDETWSVLAKTWNEQQLIEFPMMVGQYVATAFVQNALRIRLSPTNPGLTHR